MVEVVSLPVIVNLRGNHEYSIFGGSLDRLATDRGRAVLKYTNTILTEESKDYLDSKMNHDGIENVTNGYLIYTDELVKKVKDRFDVDIPKNVHLLEAEGVANLLIEEIIKPNVKNY